MDYQLRLNKLLSTIKRFAKFSEALLYSVRFTIRERNNFTLHVSLSIAQCKQLVATAGEKKLVHRKILLDSDPTYTI